MVDVIAEHQGTGRVAKEVGCDKEGLGDALGTRLLGVRDVDTPLGAVAQQLLEARQVLWCGDEQDVADPRQHERGEG